MVLSVSWWIWTALARAWGSLPLLCPETWLPSALWQKKKVIKKNKYKDNKGIQRYLKWLAPRKPMVLWLFNPHWCGLTTILDDICCSCIKSHTIGLHQATKTTTENSKILMLIWIDWNKKVIIWNCCFRRVQAILVIRSSSPLGFHEKHKYKH